MRINGGKQHQSNDPKVSRKPIPKTGKGRLYPLKERLCPNNEVLILHEFDSLPTITSKDWWRADLA
ncbi:hypothetical protein AG1IA_01160 [Rhizoctonia solani AG-1 IA]|uniref:Uncharacterized protein n=1 Tax=Thanatephorus cucumeris (strain AG1-IA) TaxID=983506 RepID=L8X6V2_THACA|nr:hypothetical protein AG1IA_01160 [Rhizoctonia solani AG-1 IA]